MIGAQKRNADTQLLQINQAWVLLGRVLASLHCGRKQWEERWRRAKSVRSNKIRSGFQFYLHLFLTIWPWESHWTSVSIYFICKTMALGCVWQGFLCLEIKWNSVCKCLAHLHFYFIPDGSPGILSERGTLNEKEWNLKDTALRVHLYEKIHGEHMCCFLN